MTREQQLLIILNEECTEVAKDVCKALRFGLDDREPGQPFTNRQKIAREFNELFSVLCMLKEEGVFKDEDLIDINQLDAKKERVEKWLAYSKDKNI